MKTLLSIVVVACAACLVGCASMFHDPLAAAYQSGKISKQEYEQQCRENEEALARNSPAYWELHQTISQNHFDLSSR